MSFETVGRVRLYYDSHGDDSAPVILLIMGLGTQCIAWPDSFVQALVDKGFRVIRFDNRDIGESSWFTNARTPHPLWLMMASRFGLLVRIPYALEDMADDAIGLLDALGIADAHIVGASMGGMIAQLVAAKAPDRVRSLTSIMSSSGAPDLPGPTGELRKRLMQRRPANASRDHVVAETVMLLKLIGYPDPARSEDDLRALAERAYDRGYNPMGARRQLLAIIADASRTGRLKTINSPTLVVHGAADPLVPLACGEDCARLIPGARLEVIDAMGHDLPPSQQGRIVASIAAHAHAADRVPATA